jgi:hypothetical protein
MAGFTVKLENPPGTPVPSNQLTPGQPLHISCQGPLNGFSTYDLTIEPISPKNAFATIQDGGTADLFGNWATDIIVPNVIATAHLRVTVSPTIGNDEVNMYLGIGEQPPPIPKPVSWTTVAIWTGVIVGGGLLIYAGVQIFKSRRPQQVTLVAPKPLALPSSARRTS